MLMMLLLLYCMSLYAAADEAKVEWNRIIIDHDGDVIKDALLLVDHENEQWLAALIESPTEEELGRAKDALQRYPLSKITDLGGLSVTSRTFDSDIFCPSRSAWYRGYKSHHEHLLKELRQLGRLSKDLKLCVVRGFLREHEVVIFAPEEATLQKRCMLYVCWPQDREILEKQLRGGSMKVFDAQDDTVRTAALAINMLTLLKDAKGTGAEKASKPCQCIVS